MRKVISKYCIRCGEGKRENPNGCNSWGAFYGRHIFTYLKPVTREEKRVADLEFQLMLKT